MMVGVSLGQSCVFGCCSALLALYGTIHCMPCLIAADAFSYALSAELKQFNIDVTSVLPGYVATSMSNIKRSSLMVPSPDKFGHVLADSIGTARTIPYWVHSLYVAAVSSLPESLVFPQVLSNMQVRVVFGF
jgi:short-subunit dehydrogenase